MFRTTCVALATFGVGLAYAQEESTCATAPGALEFLPSPDAREVPLNARVLVQLPALDCEGPTPQFRLLEQGIPVEHTLREWSDRNGVATYALEPARRLEADAEYSVEVAGLGVDSGAGVFMRFATGRSAVTTSHEAPRLRIDDVEYVDGVYKVNADIGPSRDVAPFELLHIGMDLGGATPDDESAYLVTLRPDPEGWSESIDFEFPGVELDELCLVARQQDVAGQWSSTAHDCLPVRSDTLSEGRDTGGCQAGVFGPPAAADLMLLALLGWWFRRRTKEPLATHH